MRKYYVCPFCNSEKLVVSGYEDGGGDYGEGLTGVYECLDCGMLSSEDDAFYGWEEVEQSSGNPDLNNISGGRD